MTPRPALVAAALLGLVVALLGLAPPWEAFGLAALLAASMALMHRAIGLLDLRHITFPAFWYLTYLAAVVVPGLVVAADGRDPLLGEAQDPPQPLHAAGEDVFASVAAAGAVLVHLRVALTR